MKKRYEVLIVLVIILLVAYVLKDIDFYEVYDLLKSINRFYFGLSFLSGLCVFLLWNLRFKNSLSGLVKGNYWFLLDVLFAGIFLNTITPGTGIGGEPARTYFLSKKYKKPKTKFLGVILADKSLNLIVFFIFVIFSILFVLLFVNIPFYLKIIFESVLVALVVLGVFIFIYSKRREEFKIDWIYKLIFKVGMVRKGFKNFKEFKKYIEKRIRNLSFNFKSVFSNKKNLVFGLFVSFLVWIMLFFISYFLFLAFGQRVNFVLVVIVVTIGYLIGDLSPVPGGIGLMESTMFLLYSAMGVSVSLAAVIALLSRVIYYFYAIVIGGIGLLYLKSKLGK